MVQKLVEHIPYPLLHCTRRHSSPFREGAQGGNAVIEKVPDELVIGPAPLSPSFLSAHAPGTITLCTLPASFAEAYYASAQTG
ncbi:MAG: hypothetical protein A3H71_02070 [Candidatus Sungbacteria bacterium RIFCSPLOWO2_02_FULL_48_13b]|uniref:Uncharacterized protein n=2 Tax=Candidatus Sungiibacteriota TaxID=1817917 RepID=A0A1G2LF55_9BACT|nr:MAG: hypothetical protein A3C12_01540 [Candidatus Sungbacteria bacterium RIFCSPHIGHO2_02_FULL_49_20]OHA10268.1 MAG: hypothetical protein A3H71_02070 [Candidatus Sungbacteria bacterium RIFCSPLOWO2_02_FULL_48_13b]